MAVVHTIGVSWAGNTGGTGIPAKSVYVSGTAETNVDGFFTSGATVQPFSVQSGQAQSLFIYSDQPVLWYLNQSGGSAQSGGYTFTIPAGGVNLFASGQIGSQPFSGNINSSVVYVSGLSATSGANFSVRVCQP